MSEENVEIRIDAKVGGNAAAGLDDLARKSREASQEVARMQAKYEELMSAAGRSTAQTSAAWEGVKQAEQQATAAAMQYADAVRGTPFVGTPTTSASANTSAIRKALTPAVSQETIATVGLKSPSPGKAGGLSYSPEQPLSFLEPRSKHQPIAAALSLAGQAGQGGTTALATTGLDVLASKTKQVNDGAAKLATTYQLLDDKQSALAKAAKYKLSEQPISFVGPQSKPPTIYRLSDEDKPKPREREIIRVVGTPPPLPAGYGAAQPAQSPRPLSPFEAEVARLRAEFEVQRSAGTLSPRQLQSQERYERDQAAAAKAAARKKAGIAPEGYGEEEAERLGRGLRGLLARLGTKSANMISGTLLAGFAAHMVGSTMSGIAGMSNTLQNTSLVSGERTRRVVEEAPLVGSLFKGAREMGEAFSGLTEHLRRANLEIETFSTKISNYSQMNRELQGVRNQEVQVHGRVASTILYQPHTVPAPTPGNRFEMQQWEKRTAVEQQIAEARRQGFQGLLDVEEAKRQVGASRKAFDLGSKAVAQGKREEQTGIATGSQEITDLGRRRRAAGLAAQQEAGEALRRSQEAEIEARKTIANANSAERKAIIQSKRDELAEVRQKEQSLSGRYQTYGSMTPGSRSMLTQAARQAKQLGWESLGEYQKGLVSQFSPEYAKKQNEILGQKYEPEVRELLGLTPDEILKGKERLPELRDREIKANQEIQVNINTDAKLLAQEIAKEIGPLFKDVMLTIKSVTSLRDQIADIKQALAAAAHS